MSMSTIFHITHRHEYHAFSRFIKNAVITQKQKDVREFMKSHAVNRIVSRLL